MYMLHDSCIIQIPDSLRREVQNRLDLMASGKVNDYLDMYNNNLKHVTIVLNMPTLSGAHVSRLGSLLWVTST